MHDPMTVAFELVRPWPSRATLPSGSDKTRWEIRYRHRHGSHCEPDCHITFPWWKPGSYSRFWVVGGRRLYWPAMITVWHNEPGGCNSGEVCKQVRRWRDADGQWHLKTLHAWRWHVRHWSVQVHSLQNIRRRLLTRCEWCGGRSRKHDVVNHSAAWHRERTPWWRGERGLCHADCSAVDQAHRTCSCVFPHLAGRTYGECAACGRFYPHARTDVARRRSEILQTVPRGTRLAAKIMEEVRLVPGKEENPRAGEI